METTRIYGSSDDLIEFEGQYYGECGGGDYKTLLSCSDGTILIVKYGKEDLGGVWDIKVLREGELFESLEICNDEDADIYSDIVTMKPGLKWVYASSELEKVQ